MNTISSLTAEECQHLTGYLADAHNAVLRAVRPFSDRQLDFKPAPDRWSISENVEHMTIVHNLVLNYIQQVIALPPNSKESAWIGREEEMLQHIRSRATPLKVPEIGAPKNQWPHEELFRRFDETRDCLVEFSAATDAPLRSFCFPHPVFGEKVVSLLQTISPTLRARLLSLLSLSFLRRKESLLINYLVEDCG